MKIHTFKGVKSINKVEREIALVSERELGYPFGFKDKKETKLCLVIRDLSPDEAFTALGVMNDSFKPVLTASEQAAATQQILAAEETRKDVKPRVKKSKPVPPSTSGRLPAEESSPKPAVAEFDFDDAPAVEAPKEEEGEDPVLLAVKGESSMIKLLTAIIDAGLRDRKAITKWCVENKKSVPLLSRVANVEQRVSRTLVQWELGD